MSHTPGPWQFVQGGTGDFPTWNVRIWPAPASLVPLPGIAPMNEMDANARLIAAAPDLLAALQFVMSAHGEQLDLAFQQANDAIEKATGESRSDGVSDLIEVVEQILDAGHLNTEYLARLRAAWEAI